MKPVLDSQNINIRSPIVCTVDVIPMSGPNGSVIQINIKRIIVGKYVLYYENTYENTSSISPKLISFLDLNSTLSERSPFPYNKSQEISSLDDTLETFGASSHKSTLFNVHEALKPFVRSCAICRAIAMGVWIPDIWSTNDITLVMSQSWQTDHPFCNSTPP